VSAPTNSVSATAAQVTPAKVDSYLADLNSRVSSVTVWNAIYMLRMATRLLGPKADFAWLAEIEKDLAVVMEPRSKFDRVVLSQHLIQAGLTLIVEAKQYAKSPFQRAKGIRNGLIIALLAAGPIRVKNYTALDIGTTFKEVDGTWWIIVPRRDTKTNGGEARPVPDYLNTAIDLYLRQSRPMLIGKRGVYNCPLDIVTNRTEVHNQEPGHADLEDYPSNHWGRCTAASVSDRGCDGTGRVCWRQTASYKRGLGRLRQAGR